MQDLSTFSDSQCPSAVPITGAYSFIRCLSLIPTSYFHTLSCVDVPEEVQKSRLYSPHLTEEPLAVEADRQI